MPAPLGTTERTNELLREASAQTGLSAPTFPQETAKIVEDIGAKYGNTPITAESLTPTSVMDVTQPNASPIPDISALSSLLDTPTQGEQEYNAGSDLITSLEEQLSGEAGRRAQLEKEAGIRGKTDVLDDLAGQLDQIMAEQAAIPLALQNEAQGRFSMVQLGAKQNEALRNNAIRALTVGALHSAADRKLNRAISFVDRAVAAEFDPIRNKLQAAKDNLTRLKDSPTLTREEAKRATLLSIGLDARTRFLDQQKSDKTDARNLALAAVKNYPNDMNVARLAQKVMESGNLDEAVRTLGQFQTDPIQTEKTYLEMLNIRDQMNNRAEQLDIARRELALKETDAKNTGLDPASLLAYANQYASTGAIPTGLPKGTFGLVAGFAKELPKQKGTIVDMNTNVKSSSLGAEQEKAFAALYSAIELSKQLQELDKQRWAGVVSGTFGKVFGDEDQQAYVDLRDQIVDLISRARSGAALTAQEEKHYKDMLPGRFAEPFNLGAEPEQRITNFTTTLTNDLKNKAATQGLSIYGLSEVDVNGRKFTVGDVVETKTDGVTKRYRVLPNGDAVEIP